MWKLDRAQRDTLATFVKNAELYLTEKTQKKLTTIESDLVAVQASWMNYKQQLQKLAGRADRGLQVAAGKHKGGPNSKLVLADTDNGTDDSSTAREERWALGGN